MKKKAFPSQEQEKFIIRLPDGMRQQIAEAAKAGSRSMNAEIIHRLTRSFVGYFGGDPEQDEKALDALLHPSGTRERHDPERLAERLRATATALQSLSSDLRDFPSQEATASEESAPPVAARKAAAKRSKN